MSEGTKREQSIHRFKGRNGGIDLGAKHEQSIHRDAINKAITPPLDLIAEHLGTLAACVEWPSDPHQTPHFNLNVSLDDRRALLDEDTDAAIQELFTNVNRLVLEFGPVLLKSMLPKEEEAKK